MSDDKPTDSPIKSSLQQAAGSQPTAPVKTTLPMGSVPVVNIPASDPATAPTRQMQAVADPDEAPVSSEPDPAQWGKERDLISSASAPRSQRMNAVSGTLTLEKQRVSESRARQLISSRFAQYDYDLVFDFTFTHDDVLVTLDGFDPARRVGYQYISHADQDVVTDHNAAASEKLKHLERKGVARVLVIHDGEVMTDETLIALVDTFLSTPSPG